MIEKLLSELAEKLAGSKGLAVFQLLKNKKDVNEFKIAKKLDITINQARNILYKFYEQGIVSFIRKKEKRKGWYIYYWTFETKKALELIIRLKEKEIQQQLALLKSRENKAFYICQECNIEMTEETALRHNFTCPECGSVLQLSQDEKTKELKRKIAKLSTEIKEIKELLEKSLLAGKIQKKKERGKAEKQKKPKRKSKKEKKQKQRKRKK